MSLPKPYYEHEGIVIYHGDCLEIMPEIEAGSVDMVLTDPPYGENQATWDKSKPIDIAWDYMADKLKPGGVLYYWGFWGHADWVLINARRVGLTEQSKITWWFRTGRPEKLSYREDTENAWYFSKNEPNTFNCEADLEPYEDEANYKRYQRAGKHPGTVWIASRVFHNHPENVGHPTQKPLVIIQKMVRISSNSGDIILDPFMGSGTTGVACVNTGRRFIGIEINEGYCEIAKKRIMDAQAQCRMTFEENIA